MEDRTTNLPPAAAWVRDCAAAQAVVLMLLFGALTALSAQVTIWKEPVPFTSQVLLVLLSGALLGPRMGAASQLAYLGFGLMGAPVFAGGRAGLTALLGPTAGYLVAFPLAAWLVGWLTMSRRVRFARALAANLAAVALILALGSLWLGLYAWLTGLAGGTAGLGGVLAYGYAQGAAPFIALDAGKAVVAALIAWRALRQRSG
ncbi:MAG: biotin transporter BioY [Armatimonadetes bacterium]|nr:biotin transporter BioY [Armatimonadota bacterium]